MKLIEGILYLEFPEMVECGVSENTLTQAKRRNSNSWHFINDPADKRKVLIGYDRLTEEYKRKVDARFGNPYDLVARQPILAMVQADHAADEFFFTHKYELNGKPVGLTAQQEAQSIRSYAWLSLMARTNDRKGMKEIMDTLGLKDIPSFFVHVRELVELEKANGKSETYSGPRQLPGNFPASYQNMKEKAGAFSAAPCPFTFCLPLGLGNKTAAKLGKTAEGYDEDVYRQQVGVIRQVARLHTNMDAAQVHGVAMSLFKELNLPTISASRVYQIMQENKENLTPGRRGKKTYMNEVAIQVKRKRPEFPIRVWSVDGWTAELLFQEEGKYHHRLDVVVVLDPFNDYPIGFAIGDHENTDLIRLANRNAIIHLRELAGEFLRPGQIQTDNYGKKVLAPFYQAMAHLHTPAAVGNAKAKPIERYFAYLNKTYCQKMANWASFNITARRENQGNKEMLHLMRHHIPDRAGVAIQIEEIIRKERAKKLDAYMAGLTALAADQRHTLGYMGIEWLRVFGSPVGGTNQVTGQGIIKRINGANVTYDCFEPLFRQQLHLDWQILADREDLTRVLAVSPDGKQQFLLHEKRVLPMAAVDHSPEDWAYLTQIRQANGARVEQITQLSAEDSQLTAALVSQAPMLDKDAEQVLKIMPIYGGQQKQQLQVAKGLHRKEQKRIAAERNTEDAEWLAQQQAFHNSRTDITQYLD